MLIYDLEFGTSKRKIPISRYHAQTISTKMFSVRREIDQKYFPTNCCSIHIIYIYIYLMFGKLNFKLFFKKKSSYLTMRSFLVDFGITWIIKETFFLLFSCRILCKFLSGAFLCSLNVATMKHASFSAARIRLFLEKPGARSIHCASLSHHHFVRK